ncbi:MAG: alpha/beta fold hydrolase, partial [Quinella sp. 2Q5]|nr:alpha/beta fold hydrolase [Quinella sp. 2Q5]
KHVTITGGKGDDTIDNYAESVTFKYSTGDGNDSISGMNSTSQFVIDNGEGKYKSVESGDDVLIGVGNATITLSGAAALDTLLIDGVYDGVLDTSTPDTTPAEQGVNITNETSDTVITGTENADTITNSGNDVTITPDAGDDLVSLAGGVSGVQINYTSGDGNDSIVGFNASSTLSVGSSAYSTQVSGNDLIITVGESKITLVDAANLSNPNIESTNPVVLLVEMILKRTAAGYPVASGIFLNPDEIIGEEPDNYATKEAWNITSADNLNLHGVCYKPENSDDKWVVLVHGYGLNHKAMYPFTYFYLANGYNVLMIDQRAAGESDGTWLTMGAAESQDVALWTQEIARRNSNAKITLHGVSMGSATAMLAAARSDAANVTSLIEDCGYTDAIKLFNVIGDAYLGISGETVAAMDSVGHGMMGYYLHDASPIGSISSAKMPTLFISGDDDGVVPVSMLSELYDASGADVKEVFTVKGAGHAQAGLNDPVGYSNAVFRFVAEANGEGWNTENVADDISLRGTKYNDTIANSGDNVTINTAAGDDYISLSGASNVIDYTSGDGSDIVAGLSSTDTVSISGSTYTTLTSGSDVIISVGEGSITLQGAADLETLNIIGTYDTQPVDGGVNIVNETSNTVITGTANNDTIINRASSVTAQALAGNDSIHNNGNSVTIDAGAGSDTINNYGDNVLIDVGAGNDSVMNHGEGVSISGGKGNDNLFSSTENGTVFRYAAGDGFDIVRNFDSKDTLLIADSDFTTTKIGDDIVVTVGEGSITVRGAGLLESPNIIGEGSEPADEGVDITNTTNDTVITGTAESDTITNSGVRVTVRTFAGDDYIANVVDSSVTTATLGNVIDAGDGSDTIYNYHTYNPTLLGGNGDDSIVVSRGHLTFVDGGDGNDTIEGQPVETLESSNWSFGGHATILGGAGDDLIIPIYANNSSIDGGAGNDIIIGNGKDATIDGGEGNNFIELTTVEGGATGQIIVFNGKTTVEGFNTGFGEGSDTVYIKGDAPAVDFKADGLTLYYEDRTKSLTFSDITETAGFNIYYEAYDEYTKEVFIADDDWYDVSEGAADYYVGATAKKHHGIDFSSVSSNVNVTLDTDYESTEATFWVNNVYSIKGGAGLTTITGSAKSDTIISGSGSTTINAGAGNDLLTGNGKTVFNIDDGATTTVHAAAGDTINADDTVRFIKGGTAHIVDGKLASVSPDAIVNINGNVSVGSAVDDVTVVDGEETTLTAADAKIFVGPNGATLSGYDIDTNAFVIDAADADDISEKIIDEELWIDRGTFHAANQADVLLEDLDTSKGTFVKFITADGKKNIFGWDPQGGGLLDGSDVNGKQILFGAAPGGISTIRGGSKNDTIFTGANGTVSLSGGTDIVYLEGKNAELRLGDGTVDGTARIVYGFSNSDTVTVNDAEDLSVKIVKDTLRLRKNDSVLIFDEVTNLEGANGLQVQSGDETYTLRTDYDGGLTKADYFWQDDANNFYRPDSTLVINDDGTRREYFIEEGSGRVKIDDFNFATDAINLKSIDGLTYMGSNLFIKPSDDDWVVIENGAGKNINVNIGGEKFVGQLGKQLTYDDDVTNYIGEKISISAAQTGDIDIDLSDDKFCDVHVLDAGAFNGDATLIGGDLDDKITASKGAASLWGGVGGNDILIGNGAGNTFHYLLGDGNDEIRNAHDGDAINLLDITLADIASADVNSWGVRLTMNDGGTLTVNSTADVTYNLSDGSFKANHQSREWQQA